jgi:Domain of unknown function (DUF1918)
MVAPGVGPAMRAPSSSRSELTPGDAVVVRHRHQGQTDLCERSAVVLELPHRCPWPCRVRWDDNGLEELLYPRGDLVIARRSGDESPGGQGAAGSVTRS